MNEVQLCDALRERVKDITKNMQLEFDNSDSTTKAYKQPQVIDGYLPPKRSTRNAENEEVPDYPFIIIRPTDGRTPTNEASQVTVSLLIGCFSEDYDGYKACLLVLAAIRTALMAQPTLDQRFRMEMPFEWQQPEDQPYPEFMLQITTRWTVPTPQDIEQNEVI